MTTTPLDPDVQMAMLEGRLSALKEEASDKIVAVSRDYSRIAEPIEARLKALQRRNLKPELLIAEHKALQAKWWPLYKRDDEKSGYAKGVIYRELQSTEDKLKLLGIDVETPELHGFILYPPPGISLFPKRARK